jgi:hypothetical protein
VKFELSLASLALVFPTGATSHCPRLYFDELFNSMFCVTFM